MAYPPLITPLQSGDVIGIAYTNFFMIGVFRGYGKVGNLQYYSKNLLGSFVNGQPSYRFIASYINADPNGRVIKLGKESFTDQEWKELNELRQLLLKHNYIK